jgi:hypothetical protein
MRLQIFSSTRPDSFLRRFFVLTILFCGLAITTIWVSSLGYGLFALLASAI